MSGWQMIRELHTSDPGALTTLLMFAVGMAFHPRGFAIVMAASILAFLAFGTST
jgi:hypothetical protein